MQKVSHVNLVWKRPILSMNYFERALQELWPQIKEQILYRIYFLQNSHYLRKITTDCFSFLKVCMYLISNFTCKGIQSLNECRVVAIESLSIELEETIVHKCFKKSVFEILKELILYFIPIRTWVENLHIKAVLKILWLECQVIFTRPSRTRLVVTSQTYKLRCTLYWCFHCISIW